MRSNILFGSLLMLILAVICSSTSLLAFDTIVRSSVTVYVDDDNTTGPWDGTLEHPYQTITEGLENVLAGDTLFVFSGTYTENIIVDKSITMLGEDRDTTIIDGGGVDDIVSVTADDVIIRRFTVQNTDGTGIRVNTNNNMIHLNRIREADIGIIFDNALGNTLSENEIVHNVEDGVRCMSSGITITQNNISFNDGNGINSWISNPDITENNVTNNGIMGIWLDSCDYNNIADNNVSSNLQNGILLWSCVENTVFGNNICDNVYGIGAYLMSGSQDNTISNNLIRSNSVGVGIEESDYNIILDNRVEDCSTGGVGIYDSFYNDIIKNNVSRNGYGIMLDVSADNLIYHNNLTDNAQQANIPQAGYANSWDNGYPSGGNYWSDYVDIDAYWGVDQNIVGSDGIFDQPNIIDADNEDNYPLVNPYTPPDIAIISVTSSDQVTTPGLAIQFYVNIVNQGTLVQEFDVSVSYERLVDPLIGTQTITLLPGMSKMLSFPWVVPQIGVYEITASTGTIIDEIDLADNTRKIYICCNFYMAGGCMNPIR